jgi:hypothetical protein
MSGIHDSIASTSEEEAEEIELLWREAGNTVQWQKGAARR